LRAAGLSRNKLAALRALTEQVSTGKLAAADFARLDDAALFARLTAVPGIGPWSAHVFMMRGLRRPDVFPAGDQGIRTALVRLDGRPVLPTPLQAAQRAQPWAPFRSYAASYLWRTGWQPARLPA
jgi:DNA-3-methyladenine glycosylase II